MYSHKIIFHFDLCIVNLSISTRVRIQESCGTVDPHYPNSMSGPVFNSDSKRPSIYVSSSVVLLKKHVHLDAKISYQVGLNCCLPGALFSWGVCFEWLMGNKEVFHGIEDCLTAPGPSGRKNTMLLPILLWRETYVTLRPSG